MDYSKTIRNVGKIHVVSNVNSGKGISSVKRFLELLVIEVAKLSANYINETCEASFSFSERQSSSYLLPAISMLTKGVVLSESPINRKIAKTKKIEGKEYTGFLDYWCRYNGFDLAIEVKQDKISYNSGQLTQDLKDHWTFMDKKQLKAINKELKDFAECCKGVIPLALHVIPIYERKKGGKYEGKIERLLEIQSSIMNEVNPISNWSALISFSDDLVKTSVDEYSHTKIYYPGLIFMCRINETILV